MNLNIPPHDVKEMALAYSEATDEYSSIPDAIISSFKQLVNAQFSDISKRIRIDFVDFEPYGQNPKIEDMLKDFHSGFLRIHTTGNDSKVWGKFTNLQFRAVHDYIHCLFNLDFTHIQEVIAFKKQMEFSFTYNDKFPWLNWETYVGVLRSEIVYQSAYKEYFGEFHIDQKIILKELK